MILIQYYQVIKRPPYTAVVVQRPHFTIDATTLMIIYMQIRPQVHLYLHHLHLITMKTCMILVLLVLLIKQ